MSSGSKKTCFYLIILILLISLQIEKGSSQPVTKEEGPPKINIENVSFRVREINSPPSPLKMLEVHVEILNQSQQLTVPPDSIKAVVVPKEVKFPEGVTTGEFVPPPGEITLNNPLPPGIRQILIIGFSIPNEKLKSITFEVHINPPDGEKKTVTWEGE